MENKSIHREILVREFVDSFFKNNTKWGKIFNNYTYITKTSSFKKINIEYQDHMILKGSFIEKIFFILILVVLTFKWIVVFLYVVFNVDFIILIPLTVLSFIIYFIYYNTLRNKEFIYSFLINKNGIYTEYKSISWTNVSETYILERKEGKSNNSYLLILKDDNTFELFDLDKFYIYNNKLANIIEHYKNTL